MVITAIGGDDFQIGEMKQSLEIVRHSSGDQTRIITGVNTDPAYTGRVFITVIAIEYDQETAHVPDHTFSPPPPQQIPQKIVRKAEEETDSSGELFQGEFLHSRLQAEDILLKLPRILSKVKILISRHSSDRELLLIKGLR
jgi:cell division GTPase FtsZ